ncbi:MAG: uroporphyrinogen decarboxylase family protein [Treponemataceae bacterium]
MTARERLLAALSHRESDRLPVDLGGTSTTTITQKAYTALRSHLGFPPVTPRILSLTAGSIRPDDDVLEHFRVDSRGVKPGASGGFKASIGKDGEYETYFDEWGIGSRRPIDSGLYFDQFFNPLKGKDEAFIRGYPFPRGDDPGRIVGLREECLRLRAAGYPVILSQSIGTGILHGGTALFGFEDYFCRLLLESELIDEVSERILQGKLSFWGMVLDEIGDLLDVVTEADDLGTQRGPFLGVEDYRRRIKPFQARLFSFIKSRAPHIKIFYHSCGSVIDFIPDLIEIGIDALNPVQLSALGMDPAFLKREYGRDLCFWGGGVDTQDVLPHGTPSAVRAEVHRRLSVWMKGGGYIFSTVHNIQADVPPENVVALFAAVDDFR